MTDTTDTTTVESSDTDDQQAVSEQSKTKTATEFFAEKYADEEEETEPVWIDPKDEELSKHGFVAGQTGAGKSGRLAGLLDDEDADGERGPKS